MGHYVDDRFGSSELERIEDFKSQKSKTHITHECGESIQSEISTRVIKSRQLCRHLQAMREECLDKHTFVLDNKIKFSSKILLKKLSQ